MIEKLTHVPIVVSDQEQALHFYTEVLGLEKRADYQLPGNPRWLTVAPKGEELEFILAQGKQKVEMGVGPEAGTAGNHIAFLTEDCLKGYERLKARGVDFHVGAYKEPQKQAWGISASFKDPDGNLFTMLQPSLAGKASTTDDRIFQKTTHVPIIVGNQDRALKFYTEGLGFEKRQDYQQAGRPRWLTVAPKGLEIEFILQRGQYLVDPRTPPDADSGGNHWVLRTNDCRKDVDLFRSRGVKFQEPAPKDEPFGVYANFTDSEGNHFSLLQPAQKRWKG